MSLRLRIVLVLTLAVSAFAAVDNVLQRIMVARGFENLERAAAARDAARVREAISGEIAALAQRCHERAAWDPTVRFVRGADEGYRTDNLGPRALSDLGLDLLYLCDASGRVVFGRIEDPTTRAEIRLRDFPRGAIAATHPLLAVQELGRPAAGLLQTERGPLLAASRPIRPREDDSAEPAGWVLAGRFLGSELVAELSARIGVPFEAFALEGADVPSVERALVDRVTAASGPVPVVASPERLHVYAAYPDLRGRPAVLLRAELGREITQRGWETVNWTLLSTAGSALLLLFVLMKLLQRHVVLPLSALTRHALEVGRTDDTSTRIALDRDDELGQLGREFDAMLEKLAKSRRQLARNARAAGMSEIAAGVMHNVGNALNGVTVAAGVAIGEARALAVEDLEKLVAVLGEHEHDLAAFVSGDPRGKFLLPVLRDLCGGLGQRRTRLMSELERLAAGLDEIVTVVAAQQRHAGASGVLEKASLAAIIDEALVVCRHSGAPLEGVEIVREFASLPPRAVDGHRLSEVLVQLLRNACQALADRPADQRRLTVRLAVDDAQETRIEVADSGCGIAAEDLERIFRSGFTTRPGCEGFGLHVAANAAREMGATLTAHSAGVGAGATFVVRLDALPRPALPAAVEERDAPAVTAPAAA